MNKLEKYQLVHALLSDFLTMFPKATQETYFTMRMRLNLFTISELELLYSQLGVKHGK